MNVGEGCIGKGGIDRGWREIIENGVKTCTSSNHTKLQHREDEEETLSPTANQEATYN